MPKLRYLAGLLITDEKTSHDFVVVFTVLHCFSFVQDKSDEATCQKKKKKKKRQTTTDLPYAEERNTTAKRTKLTSTIERSPASYLLSNIATTGIQPINSCSQSPPRS
uniref:Uncharacterized protein n=1 Tax=Bionectria ochroleuca TaxID=29856 RepID=A0A8H7N0M8_BIOOC